MEQIRESSEEDVIYEKEPMIQRGDATKSHKKPLKQTAYEKTVSTICFEMFVLLFLLMLNIFMGICHSFLGLTLLWFEKAANIRFDLIGLLFTSRGIGHITGLVISHMPSEDSYGNSRLTSRPLGQQVFSPLLSGGLGMLTLAHLFIPWIHHLWLLLPCFMLQGSGFTMVQISSNRILSLMMCQKRRKSANCLKLLPLAVALGMFLAPIGYCLLFGRHFSSVDQLKTIAPRIMSPSLPNSNQSGVSLLPISLTTSLPPYSSLPSLKRSRRSSKPKISDTKNLPGGNSDPKDDQALEKLKIELHDAEKKQADTANVEKILKDNAQSATIRPPPGQGNLTLSGNLTESLNLTQIADVNSSTYEVVTDGVWTVPTTVLSTPVSRTTATTTTSPKDDLEDENDDLDPLFPPAKEIKPSSTSTASVPTSSPTTPPTTSTTATPSTTTKESVTKPPHLSNMLRVLDHMQKFSLDAFDSLTPLQEIYLALGVGSVIFFLSVALSCCVRLFLCCCLGGRESAGVVATVHNRNRHMDARRRRARAKNRRQMEYSTDDETEEDASSNEHHFTKTISMRRVMLHRIVHCVHAFFTAALEASLGGFLFYFVGKHLFWDQLHASLLLSLFYLGYAMGLVGNTVRPCCPFCGSYGKDAPRKCQTLIHVACHLAMLLVTMAGAVCFYQGNQLAERDSVLASSAPFVSGSPSVSSSAVPATATVSVSTELGEFLRIIPNGNHSSRVLWLGAFLLGLGLSHHRRMCQLSRGKAAAAEDAILSQDVSEGLGHMVGPAAIIYCYQVAVAVHIFPDACLFLAVLLSCVGILKLCITRIPQNSSRVRRSAYEMKRIARNGHTNTGMDSA